MRHLRVDRSAAREDQPRPAATARLDRGACLRLGLWLRGLRLRSGYASGLVPEPAYLSTGPAVGGIPAPIHLALADHTKAARGSPPSPLAAIRIAHPGELPVSDRPSRGLHGHPG